MKENSRRFLFDHVALILAVGAAIFGAYNYFKDPQVAQASKLELLTMKVEYIENQGMLYIHDNITEMKGEVVSLQKEQRELGKNVARILGILNSKENAN